MRIDRALRADVGRGLRSWPVRAFLCLELGAGLVFAARNEPGGVATVLFVWAAMLVLAFLCWWAGRLPGADPTVHPLPAPAGRLGMALAGAAGLAIASYGLAPAFGAALALAAIGGWLLVAWRASGTSLRGFARLSGRPSLEVRPFLPLFLVLFLPRLALLGPTAVGLLVRVVPSGIGQQALLLPGLFCPLEAVLRRSDAAAVAAASVFAALHVPHVLGPNAGDWVSAAANAVIYQGSAALLFCLAYVRHRATIPLGVVHAAAIV